MLPAGRAKRSEGDYFVFYVFVKGSGVFSETKLNYEFIFPPHRANLCPYSGGGVGHGSEPVPATEPRTPPSSPDGAPTARWSWLQWRMRRECLELLHPVTGREPARQSQKVTPTPTLAERILHRIRTASYSKEENNWCEGSDCL